MNTDHNKHIFPNLSIKGQLQGHLTKHHGGPEPVPTYMTFTPDGIYVHVNEECDTVNRKPLPLWAVCLNSLAYIDDKSPMRNPLVVGDLHVTWNGELHLLSSFEQVQEMFRTILGTLNEE